MKISIIIPVYNEAENVRILFKALYGVLEKLTIEYEVIFIDDGSNDQTVKQIIESIEKHPEFKLIVLRRNYGQTAAMMAGFDHSSGDIIVSMDGDLQSDPEDIPRLLAKIEEGFDVCSGWRKNRKDNSITRTLPSRLANLLISWVSGVKLNDYGCTLKAYRRDVMKNVRLYGEMHRFIPIYASWNGANISEIEVNHHPRVHGKSSYGLERTFKVILDLIVVKFMSSYAQKPIYVFGGFGLLSMVASAFSFAGMIYYKFWGDKSFIETPLPLVTVMLFSIGTISILLGLIAEIVIRTYYESQGKVPYSIEQTKNIPKS